MCPQCKSEYPDHFVKRIRKKIELICGFCEMSFLAAEYHVRWARKVLGQEVFYCGASCSHKKPTWVGNCTNCGTIFERPFSAKRSMSGRYFCTRSCSASYNNRVYKSRENHPNWVNGASSYRSQVDFDVCSDCGEARYYLLMVHHRDKDRSNNDPANLVVLCYNCHALHHLVVDEKGKLAVRWKTLTTEEAKQVLNVPVVQRIGHDATNIETVVRLHSGAP